MKGYKLFVEKIDELSNEEKYRIIKNIFCLKRVKLFSLDEENGDIVFRIYDGIKYYRIRFVLTSKDKIVFCEKSETIISVYCDIFIQNFVDDGSNFSKFVKILLDEDINYFDSFL